MIKRKISFFFVR